MPHDGHHHNSPLDKLNYSHGQEITLVGQTTAPIDAVWKILTDNQQLQRWFPELRFESLQPGGKLLFEDESHNLFQELLVLDVEEPNYLSYMWGEDDMVAFELETINDDETKITFTEWVTEVTDHTVKDITGWHVCLQVIGSILEGTELINQKELWMEVFPEVEEMLNNK